MSGRQREDSTAQTFNHPSNCVTDPATIHSHRPVFPDEICQRRARHNMRNVSDLHAPQSPQQAAEGQRDVAATGRVFPFNNGHQAALLLFTKTYLHECTGKACTFSHSVLALDTTGKEIGNSNNSTNNSNIANDRIWLLSKHLFCCHLRSMISCFVAKDWVLQKIHTASLHLMATWSD